MKKILSGILVLLLASSVFADSKDSVEGIIEVADDNMFPSGHFGQAAGYLPGDSVFVTNPATGLTLQFLNLGTLDSAEGVTILLSKESAKTLGLDKGAKVHCKLNVRNGSFDESVTGQAVIDDKNYVPAAVNKEAEPVVIEAPSEVAEEASVPVAIEAPSEVAAEAPVPVAEPVVVEAPVAGVPLLENEDSTEEEIEEEIVEEPVEIVELKEETPKEPVVLVLPPNPTDEEIIEEFELEEEDFIGTKEAVEQPSPAEVAEAEEVEEVAEAEKIEEAEELEEVVVVDSNKGSEEELVIVEELAPVEVEKAPESETVAVQDVPAEESAAEETAYISNEAAEPDENVDDEYAPIVLVPTDKVVPESNAVPVEPVAPVAVAETVETAVEPVAPVAVAETVETAVEPVETKITAEASKSEKVHDFEKYVVDSESSLPKNRWYVQIVTLGNVENLNKTVRKYSKYPLKFVPNGKGAYRVLVGPLTEDEYGVVLAKFKAFGYKDAFLKTK